MNVGKTIALRAFSVTCLCRDRSRFSSGKHRAKRAAVVLSRSHKNHDLSSFGVGNAVFNISQHRSPSVSEAIRPVAICLVAICPVCAEFSQRANVPGDTAGGGTSSPHGAAGAGQGLSAQHRSEAARRRSSDASGARRARRRRRPRHSERARSARPGHGLPSAWVARLRSDSAPLAACRARARPKLRLPALWLVETVPQRWRVPSMPHTAGGVPC